MVVCADTQVTDKGCPYDKCKMKGQPMTLGQLRDHLANECNKIMLECNRCGETYKRPWKQYHDCITTYQQRLAQKQVELDQIKIGKDQEIQELMAIIKERDEQIHQMQIFYSDKEYRKQIQNDVQDAFNLDFRNVDK